MFEKDIAGPASRVELLLTDVDGVLTDGRLLFVPLADRSIVEAKAFHASDGAAIGFARRAGLKTGIISGRSSPAVAHRAAELQMDYLYQGMGRNKRPAFEEILQRSNIDPARVCYIGDDVQDLPILLRVGFSVCVPNAHAELLARVAYVTSKAGGDGALREVVELILKAQGKWDAAMSEFLARE
jgi:3-deoxy-D-manno-octulosonate 8-phosphate phosphatase (KDO 8-P phosphatase)